MFLSLPCLHTNVAEESNFFRSEINLHYKSNKELKNSESIKLKFQKETKKDWIPEVHCYQELSYVSVTYTMHDVIG